MSYKLLFITHNSNSVSHYFYQIRSLTLWDFERNCELEADFEEIVRD